MKAWKSIVIGVCLLVCGRDAAAISVKWNAPEHYKKPYVLLISIDGYRHDYTSHFKPPNIMRLRDLGSSAEGLIPIYPSKTFPNHYSIATGLYAENHGIVANHFYDPTLKETFELSNSKSVEDGRFYHGTPLWAAAGKAGMVSAVYFWPGSEAEIDGYRPSRYFRYNKATPNRKRSEQILTWLKLPEGQRPHFLMLYFGVVDTVGHKYGTRSRELRTAIEEIDGEIGYLLEGIKKTGLPINIVLVSDHGMIDMKPKKYIFLDDIADFGKARVIPSSQFFLVYNKNRKALDETYRQLKAGADFYRVYRRSEIPQRLHYSKSPRVGDLLIEANPLISLALRKQEGAKHRPGQHGYDPALSQEMRGTFFALGPGIKTGVRLKAFENIHVYPLVLRLLGLDIPEGIDAKAEVLDPILLK